MVSSDGRLGRHKSQDAQSVLLDKKFSTSKDDLLKDARSCFPGLQWEVDENMHPLTVFAMLGVSGTLFLTRESAVLRDGCYAPAQESWEWAKRKLVQLCAELDAAAGLEPREHLLQRISSLERNASDNSCAG